MESHEERLAEWERQQLGLGPCTANPCNECPWRRVSAPGYLGPYTAQDWIQKVHGEGAIECHMTVDNDGQEWTEVHQCRGAAMYRANVVKSPRNPHIVVGPVDKEQVFASPMEFIEHHDPE